MPSKCQVYVLVGSQLIKACQAFKSELNSRTNRRITSHFAWLFRIDCFWTSVYYGKNFPEYVPRSGIEHIRIFMGPGRSRLIPSRGRSNWLPGQCWTQVERWTSSWGRKSGNSGGKTGVTTFTHIRLPAATRHPSASSWVIHSTMPQFLDTNQNKCPHSQYGTHLWKHAREGSQWAKNRSRTGIERRGGNSRDYATALQAEKQRAAKGAQKILMGKGKCSLNHPANGWDVLIFLTSQGWIPTGRILPKLGNQPWKHIRSWFPSHTSTPVMHSSKMATYAQH